MAVAGQHIEDSDGGSASALAGVAGALVVFAAFLAVAMSRNGWSFEYPLDDVYIHLAMAEQIAAGGYGVNAGEFASAASSLAASPPTGQGSAIGAEFSAALDPRAASQRSGCQSG